MTPGAWSATPPAVLSGGRPAMIARATGLPLAGPGRPARRWVLVVDDDPAVRGLWVEALELAGYAAVPAADGLAAVGLARDIAPDLVILDLHMPRMSGWAFLHSAARSRRSVPVLVVSGHLVADDTRPSALGSDVVRCLPKPVDLGDLLAAVREIVDGDQVAAPAAVLAGRA